MCLFHFIFSRCKLKEFTFECDQKEGERRRDFVAFFRMAFTVRTF
jgi:hypothetical protein